MHTAKTANETLELLWNNYLTLCEQVDLDAMPPETLEIHIERRSPVRPFQIAAWLAKQGYFMTAWALWEYFSRSLCESLTVKQRKAPRESTVDWVRKALSANHVVFADQGWFSSANSLRNLIAHYGGRVSGSRAESLLERSRTAFPGIDTWKDGYLNISHEHVAELQTRIENFIEDTASQ